jgi:hypothetical protein
MNPIAKKANLSLFKLAKIALQPENIHVGFHPESILNSSRTVLTFSACDHNTKYFSRGTF